MILLRAIEVTQRLKLHHQLHTNLSLHSTINTLDGDPVVTIGIVYSRTIASADIVALLV